MSVSGPPAVDEEPLAGDVAAGIAGQQQKCSVEVFRLTVPRKQGVAQDPVLDPRLVDDRRGHLGFDETGRKAVDPDAVAAPLRCPLTSKRFQAAFGGGVYRLREAADTDRGSD